MMTGIMFGPGCLTPSAAVWRLLLDLDVRR
jgi:hypothetical protein